MKKLVLGAAAAGLVMAPASAQPTAPPPAAAATAPAPQPAIMAVPVGQAAPQLQLPANTEVLLTMNEDLTTKGGRIEVGHRFNLSVSQDVRMGDLVIIPRGTPAYGEVTWLTGKGAFGKSGKMEVELRAIDLHGRRIPVSGKYRQEGEGNTVATVAGVIVVGVFSAFITGKSARIPQGRELKAYTGEAVPVAVPAGYGAVRPAVVVPAPVPAAVPAAPVTTSPVKAN